MKNKYNQLVSFKRDTPIDRKQDYRSISTWFKSYLNVHGTRSNYKVCQDEKHYGSMKMKNILKDKQNSFRHFFVQKHQ